MKNKVLVKIKIPEIDAEYDVYLPINRKIGNIIKLLNDEIKNYDNKEFNNVNKLYNSLTNTNYKSDQLLLETDIRNGSILILIS